jgi:hypothetical protein
MIVRKIVFNEDFLPFHPQLRCKESELERKEVRICLQDLDGSIRC